MRAAPADLIGMNGYIINGKIHAHMTAQLPIDFGVATNRWTGQIPGYVLIRPDGEVALIALGAVYANHIEKTIDCLISCLANEDVR